jgi:hypothetical protein
MIFIGKLRKLSYTITGFQDQREYLWGLLFDAIFAEQMWCKRAAGTNDRKKKSEYNLYKKRAFILASAICMRLDRWNKEWPPRDWISFLNEGMPA